MNLRFVVIIAGEQQPVAVFADRHDALRWAADRFEGDFHVEEMAVRVLPAALGGSAGWSA